MPFTVTCTACSARFLLGDDLFRRKVSGKVVTLKCRSCGAEISLDATDAPTQPSHEVPRAHAAPPRPKQATAPTPRAPQPMPLPEALAARGNATITPLSPGTLLSIWDAAEQRRSTRPPADASEIEFIEDEEELPRSSSDAPTLRELKEASPPQRAHAKRAPDDFLVNLSGTMGGIMNAPFGRSALVSPPAPAVEELLGRHAAAQPYDGRGTIPLFDMSDVLPASQRSTLRNVAATSSGAVGPSDVELPPNTREPAARVRKGVVAPIQEEPAALPSAKRSSALTWLVLVAAAAGVVALFWLRERGAPPRAAIAPVSATTPSATTTPSSTAADNRTPETETPTETPTALNEAALAEPEAAGKLKPSTATSPTVRATSAARETPRSASTRASTAEEPAAAEAPVQAEKTAQAAETPAAEPAAPAAEFDRGAAVTALRAAATGASSCRQATDPSGTATLTITFAPSGRVTSANIQGPPFAGTPTGGCIANMMRRTRVPAFSGERVTVTKTIVIQ